MNSYEKVNRTPHHIDGIALAYDARSSSAVVAFEAGEVPSCTMRVVRALHVAYDAIVEAKARGIAIEQMILASRVAGIFNMGGDLALMAAAARAGDHATLQDYGRLTASLVHRTWDGLGVGLTTISVVDGDAFGGGCEAALSANFVVATAASRFAFPEVRFGLYPAMGATSLVGRRVSPAFATGLIAEGRTLGAAVALSHGLVDRVMARDGERRVVHFLRRNQTARARLGELARLRRLQSSYTYEEAEAIVLQWAVATAAAPARTLTHIERIVKAQKARMAGREALRTSVETPP